MEMFGLDAGYELLNDEARMNVESNFPVGKKYTLVCLVLCLLVNVVKCSEVRFTEKPCSLCRGIIFNLFVSFECNAHERLEFDSTRCVTGQFIIFF